MCAGRSTQLRFARCGVRPQQQGRAGLVQAFAKELVERVAQDQAGQPSGSDSPWAERHLAARGQPPSRQQQGQHINRLGQIVEKTISLGCLNAFGQRVGGQGHAGDVAGAWLLFQRPDQIEAASCRPGSGRPTSCRALVASLFQCRGPASGHDQFPLGAHLKARSTNSTRDFRCLPRRAREWV